MKAGNQMSLKDLISNKKVYASVQVDSAGRVSVNQKAFFQDGAVRKTVDSLKIRHSGTLPLAPSTAPSNKK